jgi:hypothetical protein
MTDKPTVKFRHGAAEIEQDAKGWPIACIRDEDGSLVAVLTREQAIELSHAIDRCPKRGFIRVRERRQASPSEGMRQAWTEYQIVVNGIIFDRADSWEQARKQAAYLNIEVPED